MASAVPYVRRLLGALLATAALLGVPSTTGAAGIPPYQHFRSRPDLRPPVVRILQPAHGTAPGYILIAPKRKAAQAGPMILDERGRLVWFRPLNTRGVSDFRVQHYRGRPVLTWWRARPTGPQHGSASYTVADQSYRTVAVVRPLGGPIADPHEFVLTPRGTALMTTFRNILLRGRRVADGGVQELDLRTGRVLLDWRSTRHVAQVESYARPPRDPSTPYDYFHVNSIDVDADGNLLVSARNTHAVYKLERRTGEILWRLGGKRSDFTLGRNDQPLRQRRRAESAPPVARDLPAGESAAHARDPRPVCRSSAAAARDQSGKRPAASQRTRAGRLGLRAVRLRVRRARARTARPALGERRRLLPRLPVRLDRPPRHSSRRRRSRPARLRQLERRHGGCALAGARGSEPREPAAVPNGAQARLRDLGAGAVWTVDRRPRSRPGRARAGDVSNRSSPLVSARVHGRRRAPSAHSSSSAFAGRRRGGSSARRAPRPDRGRRC